MCLRDIEKKQAERQGRRLIIINPHICLVISTCKNVSVNTVSLIFITWKHLKSQTIYIIHHRLRVLLNLLCDANLKAMSELCFYMTALQWSPVFPQWLSVHEWDLNWNKCSSEFCCITFKVIFSADSIFEELVQFIFKASWVFLHSPSIFVTSVISKGMFQRQPWVREPRSTSWTFS